MDLKSILPALESEEHQEIETDGGVARKEPRISRRQVLAVTGTVLAGGGATAAATQINSEPSTTTEPPKDQDPVGNNPTDTPEEKNQGLNIPDQGTINFILKDQEPWPEQYFAGNVDLELDTTAEELRNLHHNQHERYGEGYDSPILKQFPHKIDDSEWIRQNIYEPLEEDTGDEVPEGYFNWNKYKQEAPLDQRMKESNYPGLWRLAEHSVKALHGVSSGHDSIRAAALQAVEKHKLNNNTIVTDNKTVSDVHGLAEAITHATYDESKYEEQETWIIETDPNEDEDIIDLDVKQEYTNDKDEKHHIEVEGEEHPGEGWRKIASDFAINPDLENVEINWKNATQYDEFLKNPGQQAGMKFLDSACLAGYINKEAHHEGELPEFQDAILEVHPDRIEYELAQ